MGKYQDVYDIWQEQLNIINKNSENWTNFLKSSAFMYKYSFDDQVLIYAQRPDATACASYDLWNDRMHRWVKKGSKGIALLDRNKHGLHYVFDINDTNGLNNRTFNIWTVNIKDEKEYIQMINDKYGTFDTTLDFGTAIINMVNMIVEENIEDYVGSLKQYRQGSILEEYSDEEVCSIYNHILCSSISFQIMTRCGIEQMDYLSMDDFNNIKLFDTYDTLSLLGTTSQIFCEIGMRDIACKCKEITIRTFEQNKKKVQNLNNEDERSKIYEPDHIHTSRRLSDTKHKSGGTDIQQPLRKIEITVPTAETSRSFDGTEGREKIERTFEDDRQTSGSKNEYIDGGVIEKATGSRQADQSNGMGKAYEQFAESSNGSSAGGNHLQLDFELGGEEEKKLPPFVMSDLPKLLQEDAGLQHSKEEIIAFYKQNESAVERTKFISECYDDTLIQTFRNPWLFDFSYLGYKKIDNGLDVWNGNYLDKNTSSHLSFMQIQHEIGKLIEQGNYLVPKWERMSGIQLAYKNKVINSNVDYYLFKYRNYFLKSSSEIIDYMEHEEEVEKRIEFIKSCYPDNVIEWSIDGVPLGISKEQDKLLVYMGTYDNRATEHTLSFEIVENNINGMILSRYFDESIQLPTEKEQIFNIVLDAKDIKDNKFFSIAEVESVIKHGSGIENGKYRIYQFMKHNNGEKENIKFLKKEYGIGGASPIVGRIHEWHDAKGIRISRAKEIGKEDIKLLIDWKKVNALINELIANDKYLSQEEKKNYPSFLKSQHIKKLKYEQEQFNESKNDDKNELTKEYVIHVNDDVFLDGVEYKIIDEKENIYTLQDLAFPLQMVTYSKKELIDKIKDNVPNDVHLQPIEEEPLDYDKIIKECIDVYVDDFKKMDKYQLIKELDKDETYEFIKENVFGIVSKHNVEFPVVYELFFKSDEFKKQLMDTIFNKTYDDFYIEPNENKTTVDISNDEKEYQRKLYKSLYDFAPDILDNKSIYQQYVREDGATFFVKMESDVNKIDMGVDEVFDAVGNLTEYLEFKIDKHNKLLIPTYYRDERQSISLELINEEPSVIEELMKTSLVLSYDYVSRLNDDKYWLSHDQYVDNKEIKNKYYDKNHNEVDALYTETAIEKDNYRIEDHDIGVGTPKERYKNNVAAIKLLFSLEKENRIATKEEKDILSNYVGWGGLSEVFDDSKSTWSNEYEELKDLLSDEEYKDARESTLTSFYTPPIVIDGMYEILSNLGYQTGNILEPSCGIGNFIGRIPREMDTSKFYAVELDSISGRIAKQLYQKADIQVKGFEDTNLPDNFFDVAIGNVPFGNFKVIDRKYDKYNFNIHDYFFAKTIDKVRTGGIIAFLTSRYTMDKANDNVRRYINERCELLGAIRFPNDTFTKAANTKAVSDLLILKKRERPIVNDAPWLYLDRTCEGYEINNYFIEHPEMVLGKFELTKAMYGREDITVSPFDDITLKDALQKVIPNIKGNIEEPIFFDEMIEDDKVITIPADPNVRNYSYTVMDDDIYFRENSVMTKIELSKTAYGRTKGMIEIRDCIHRLIDFETNDDSNDLITNERNNLNRLYDEFTKEYGLINSRSNSIAFRQDSAYFLLCSLENVDENGKLKSKADIFHKRTIKAKKTITQVKTSNEALLLSLSEKAKVDLDYMQEMTGFDIDKIINELKGVIYKIPNVMGDDERYVIADEYLSGNIREKLKIAELSAELDERYKENVEALKQAMPKPLTAADIEVRLGATWIPESDYTEYMHELFNTPKYFHGDVNVSLYRNTGTYNISNKNLDKQNIKATKTYGTSRANGYRLLEDALNLRSTKIYDYYYDDDGNRKQELNKQETAIAQQKQELIKDTFKDWIFKDYDRRERLVNKYNEIFNSIRPREYNGDHLEFPNMNTEITLRKHQKDAIAHVLYGNNVLLAHVVGAGKTFEMVASCMELKRLGMCQKAMFVVPNHLIEQWGAEFLQLYPSANVLVTTKQDFQKDNRKKFCSRIATGDYDAIIIGHSMFEKIPISKERQTEMIDEQIRNITENIKEAKIEEGSSFSVKQMERTKKGLEKRLQKLAAEYKKDDVITFEQLGVDRLFVDESHNYKNLFLFTKMQNVAGIATTDAQKSSDLYMKCQYLNEITNGKGIVFATGTPISNSMTEMYTVQRYLQYDLLKEKNLEQFDSWASTFGESVNTMELAPEGNSYRMKTRFSKFYNLPELINMFKEVADIKTADMLNLPVPNAHYENIVVKPSDEQVEIVQSLGERAELVRNGNVDPKEDNMLKITNDGRKLALEQRLLNPDLHDCEHSKVNACVENVYKIYERTKDDKSTQLLFCDMSTPKKSLKYALEHRDDEQYTNVYDDIAYKLIDKGVVPHEIAYIHDYLTDKRKKELFANVRDGNIRILLGSTSKMGAGTNVQDKLIAIHDLDCPWRPSDLEQRAGRIVRQGNQNKDVYIYRYVTEQTFDSYLYQVVENKQKFISQIMTSKSPVRSAEDIDEATLNYAEIKALASGNPKIKEKMDLDIQVNKLKLAKANYNAEIYDMQNKIVKYYPVKIKEMETKIFEYKEDVNFLKPVEEFCGMTLNGKFYDDKKQAGNVLLLICDSYKEQAIKDIGEYRGFKMLLEYDSFMETHLLYLSREHAHEVVLGNDTFGNITRMDNVLDNMSVKVKKYENKLNEYKQALQVSKEEVNKPFIHEEELREKLEQLSKLNKELKMDEKENDILDEQKKERIKSHEYVR